MFKRPMVRGLSRDISRGLPRSLPNVVSGYPTATLDSILASSVFQVDGNLAASYSGSGETLLNVIAAPANGGAQSDYDFWRGVSGSSSGDEPTFKAGPPGKFTLDGGDWFRIKSNPTWIKDLARSDQSDKWWMAFAFMTGSFASSQTFWGQSNGSSAVGFQFVWQSATGTLSIRRADGTTTVSNGISGLVCAALVPSLLVVTYDKGTRGYQCALNSRTFTHTGTLSAATITASSAAQFELCNANGGSSRLLAGSEFYGSAMGNDTLTDAQLSSLVDYYNALHGRTYA